MLAMIRYAWLLRLDGEIPGTLFWEMESQMSPNPHMGVITDEPIDKRWIQEFYEKSVDAPSNELVTRNIGGLVTVLDTFLELPFGECSLETGFSAE